MTFADLEQRTNAAVMARLSNARALRVGASEDFPVIFDRAFVETPNGASGTMPRATALASATTGFVSNSTQITISGSNGGDGTYVVLDQQPDGTGMTELLLEVAA